MKDIKILKYSSCMSDTSKNEVLLEKWGVNSTFVEKKALEDLILPYLNDGYRIVQFVGDSGNYTVVLQKDA